MWGASLLGIDKGHLVEGNLVLGIDIVGSFAFRDWLWSEGHGPGHFVRTFSLSFRDRHWSSGLGDLAFRISICDR